MENVVTLTQVFKGTLKFRSLQGQIRDVLWTTCKLPLALFNY